MTILFLRVILLSLFLSIGTISCKKGQPPIKIESSKSTPITCTAKKCSGMYSGPEFINGSDIAHQFSNSISAAVGDKLKELYRNKEYSKVDFDKISMTTEGMGTGNVDYFISIPFKRVEEKCDAFTAFDHVGGWNHSPALSSRKDQLSTLLIPGASLHISQLKKTPEGLQEYWIQWKHKDYQGDCRR